MPLTEAERIPDAAEVLEVHLIAREIEVEVRAGAAPVDWAWAERRAAEAVAYARAFRDAALALPRGTDPDAPAAARAAAHRARGAGGASAVQAPRELRALETWKHGVVATVAGRAGTTLPRLDGVRVVLATLEVHDVVRDALAKALPSAGADVIVLPASVSRRAGGAGRRRRGRRRGARRHLQRRRAHARRGAAALDAAGSVAVVFGGVLNEDDGGPLPVDARPQLSALGIRCVSEIEGLGAALA